MDSGLTLLCPAGHPAARKRATGGLFGLAKHACALCSKTVEVGRVRYGCKLCKWICCQSCAAPQLEGTGAAGSSKMMMSAAFQAGVRSKSEDGNPDSLDGRPRCNFGCDCYNYSGEHRMRYWHPETKDGTRVRWACQWGSACYRKNEEHLEQYGHPGDRNYRIGLVKFRPGQYPDWENLWQFFQFFDPDESGHLSKEEFNEVLKTGAELDGEGFMGAGSLDLDKAWMAAGGAQHEYLNFSHFVTWTKEVLQLDYPLGLEDGVAPRLCRFSMRGSGGRCNCPRFHASPQNSSLCTCGHKNSMHRSDAAELTFDQFLSNIDLKHWSKTEEGLTLIKDANVLTKLQAMMTATIKPPPHNWTRDRGCKLHGVNGKECNPACAFKNRVAVPTGYKLVRAYRNQNKDLWSKFTLARKAVQEECSKSANVEGGQFQVHNTMTSQSDLESKLDESCNEWYMYHGSNPTSCKLISEKNFELAMSGTGATWKDKGKVGTPLYGFGLYFAECFSKADEYAAVVSADAQKAPYIPIEAGGGDDLYTILVCRVVGGITNVCKTNEINVDQLRREVFEGSYNSVLGDRVSALGKPYREIVVYDKDQCFPEYLLVYTRSYS